MKTVDLQNSTNDLINEMIASNFEDIGSIFGYNINIEDTDWQTVYDVKEVVLNKLKELGLEINY